MWHRRQKKKDSPCFNYDFSSDFGRPYVEKTTRKLCNLSSSIIYLSMFILNVVFTRTLKKIHISLL